MKRLESEVSAQSKELVKVNTVWTHKKARCCPYLLRLALLHHFLLARPKHRRCVQLHSTRVPLYSTTPPLVSLST